MARWSRPKTDWSMHNTSLSPKHGYEPKCDNNDGNEAIFKVNGARLCASCYSKREE